MSAWDFANAHPYVAAFMFFCLCSAVPSFSWSKTIGKASGGKNGGS